MQVKTRLTKKLPEKNAIMGRSSHGNFKVIHNYPLNSWFWLFLTLPNISYPSSDFSSRNFSMLDLYFRLNYKQINKKILTNVAVLRMILEENKLYFPCKKRTDLLKSPAISLPRQLNTLFLSSTSRPRELGCSAMGPVSPGVFLKVFSLALLFSSSSLQTFLLQIWLFLLWSWHEPNLGISCIRLLLGRLPVCFSGMQAVEVKTEWNFMKLSELIELYAFNPSLLAVRGHFSSLWAFSFLNCKGLLYWWQ